MKKVLTLIFIFTSLLIPYGCNLYDNDFSINDEDLSSRRNKEYDIVLSVDSSELYDKMTNICKDYEDKIGVKVKTDLILPYKGKQERSYLDDLKKMFDLKKGPNIFIVSSESEYNAIYKEKLAMDLYRSKNDNLNKKLYSTSQNQKLILDDSCCYGLKLSFDEYKTDVSYLIVNANTDGLEKKLSLDFVSMLLEK